MDQNGMTFRGDESNGGEHEILGRDVEQQVCRGSAVSKNNADLELSDEENDRHYEIPMKVSHPLKIE